jgi:2',3'-cyclic-nucleotide 2'-phosphodiesterase (5'-nucleotidase family)
MAFATHKNTKRPSGGRAPTTEDKVDAYSDLWEPTPVQNSEARLIILQITDVYTLENFASFKTLLQETRRNVEEATVVCMLTGDFLSPYLLSSVDQGKGMMNALNRIPMDYLTWGNHEADIPHKTVCRHVRNFKGKWLNSNMLDHEAMESQQEYEVIEIQSPDGSNTRKVGLIAVLSDDPGLYSHFQAPGAFGGATITDPWEALRKYKAILENEHNCDLIVPLQHLYVPDDHKTCRDFDFPIILSGHDHHRVDEVVDGTRLIKPGMNAASTAVIEISWPDNNAGKPKIHSRFVKTEDWAPDAEDEELNERAYDALEPLKNTELARVPSSFEPLTSLDSRGSVCTMGKYICSLIRSAMNVSRRHKSQQIDAVLLMGGNIRGNREYPLGSFFSLEALEAEVKGDEVIGVVPMPGWLLAEGIAATHAGEPIPGWMQYDQGIREDMSQSPPVITHVAGEPIDPERIYRVATKVSDLTNGQSLPWTDYYGAYPEVLPPKGAYINVQSELMSYFARNLWRKIWEALSKELGDTCGIDDCGSEERLKKLDSTGDGTVTVEEIQAALRDYLGLSVDDRELTLAEFVHSFADTNGDGTVTKRDMDVFCEELDNLYDTGGWRLYPKNTAISQIK